jgi:hypothetical protein
MKVLRIMLVFIILISMVFVCAIDAQDADDSLPLIRIERQELRPIYQSIYQDDDGALYWSKIWY